LARIEDKVEPFGILSVRDHVHEEIIGAWYSGQSLQLANLAPPNIF